MSNPTAPTKEKLDELREKILPVLMPCGVKRVWLFGSVARGEDTPNSDVDILVELKPIGQRPPLGLKWFGLEDDLRQAIGRNVDLVSESALSPYVRPYVESDKVMLYEER
ncbi:MAG: nucleotidyltransferase family protein [Chloroflexota bacterium]